MKHCGGTFLVLLGLAWGLHGADWPAFRGPAGDGRTSEKDLPLTWGPGENVRWKAALPEPGNSSPIVSGNRVFLTQPLEKKGHRRALLCFDRADGKLLWQKETPYAENEPTHPNNLYCSATPVTDGRRVIASFGSAGMVCYDFTGKQLWRYELGKLSHVWGNASSPIFYGDLVILWCGPGDRQFLLAVDKRNGKKIWQHDEPGGKFGKTASEWRGSWSTPILARIGDHDELIVGVPNKLKGFDPMTGKELWSCAGLGNLVYNSPICSPEGIVAAFSGFGGPAMAVKAGGQGDVTQTHRLWHHAKGNPQRIGSPVLLGKHVFLLCANDPVQCFELETGKEVWGIKQRLAGEKCWSSMTLSQGRIYVPNFDGDVLVLAASPRFQILAKNSLQERILSSLAVSNGELFIRTYKHLWCIGNKAGGR